MSLSVDKVGEYLGKPVNDPYGRRVGYVIGFYSDSDGNVLSFEVSFGDNDFKQISIDRFRFEEGNIILIPEWEYNAIMVDNRLKRIKSRLAALDELYARKEIPAHAYEEYKKKLDENLVKVKEEVKNTKEMLRKRIHDIEDQIVEVEKAMTFLKVSYISGEIYEKPYKTAMDLLRKSLEILSNEKDSVKKHLDRIEALESMPISVMAPGQVGKQPESQLPVKQPMQVVVLENT
ncbi:MAG: CdvA-like protein [Desulfurococcaceae archaeon]